MISASQFLEWAFLCGEYKQFITAFCRDLTLSEQMKLLDAKNLNYQRLLFCLDRENLSSMKLVLAQFKRGTKESEYIQTLQQLALEEFDKIVRFVFRDRLFTCVSNFAYAQYQRITSALSNKRGAQVSAGVMSGVGGSHDLLNIGRKWQSLEERVRE